MAYLQSITTLKIIGVIWLGCGNWFRHTSCPLAASRRRGLSRNKPRALLFATKTASNSLMFISRTSLAGDQRPSYSLKTRRGGSRPFRLASTEL
jgi:hypothetical protein